MRITNDKLVFEAGDLDTFSPEAQKALAIYTGPNLPAETILINQFDATVGAALAAFKKESVRDIAPLAEALALEKDAGKRAQVEALIDQAKEVLNVKEEKEIAVGLNPTDEPSVPKKTK